MKIKIFCKTSKCNWHVIPASLITAGSILNHTVIMLLIGTQLLRNP